MIKDWSRDKIRNFLVKVSCERTDWSISDILDNPHIIKKNVNEELGNFSGKRGSDAAWIVIDDQIVGGERKI